VTHASEKREAKLVTRKNDEAYVLDLTGGESAKAAVVCDNPGVGLDASGRRLSDGVQEAVADVELGRRRGQMADVERR
jgi:hypothetical protein